jgi:subtilisin family serine protease
MFPACLPDVVAVAALDPYGPAAYTNFGPWVDACAPGTDLVSAFFRFDGDMEVPPMPGSVDPDEFDHWARWTGTSFAAPVVAAALAREMTLTGAKARDAVARIITSEGLFRLPGLGTVVNHTPLDPGCLAAW